MNSRSTKKVNIQSSKIDNLEYGKNCKIVEPVNIYNSKLGDRVTIGPFVEIAGAKISSGTTISSHSFVCEKVEIGKNSFIGHSVTFTNDLFKPEKLKHGKKRLKKTIVGNNVKIGSGSTILPVKICSGCIIGAGSVVNKNLDIKGIYIGNPARLIRKL